MKTALIVSALLLMTSGCAGTSDNTRQSSHGVSGSCDAPHHSCVDKCHKENDGAQQQVCLSHCMKRLGTCHKNGKY